MIAIRFVIDEPEQIWDMPALEGEIRIGDYREFFVSSLLGNWSADDYDRQWQEGFERIKKHDQSCLVVSVQQACIKPRILGLINWWVLYKQGNRIYLQNKFFITKFYDLYIGSGEFNPNTCYKYIPTRRTHTTDGTKISEWYVDLEDAV